MSSQKSTGPSQRRAPRVSADGLRAVITPGTDPPARVSLLNISEAGVAVLSQVPLGDVDDAFALGLGLPPDEVTVQCRCAIRYVLGGKQDSGDEPGWLHGAEFLGLEYRASRFLGNFVRERLALAAVPVSER